ncbi:MAG TPA: methylated-DNA--[protein]-cysteine S-methyltransferase [Nitrospira sp.]|nr:methylated-DNA--[protein]-cysteine S-methyltransferase [Nitrospira sp.]
MKRDRSLVNATVFRSTWGWIGIAESAQGICAVTLPQATTRGAESRLREAAGPFAVGKPSPGLRRARTELLQYLSGDKRSFSLRLDLRGGTEFQQRVWQVLQRMPYGSLRSYQWVAGRVGGPRYARAVGNAVGANPIPMVIPCHRVVACGPSLGGFSGGLPMKRRLLNLEGTLSSLVKRQSSRRADS